MPHAQLDRRDRQHSRRLRAIIWLITVLSVPLTSFVNSATAQHRWAGPHRDDPPPNFGEPAPVYESTEVPTESMYPPVIGQPLIIGGEGPTTLVTPEYVLIQETDAPTDEYGGTPHLELEDFDITESDLPTQVRDRPFQGFDLSATYLPDWNNAGLEVTELENSVTFALPFPDWKSPLLISPGFDAYLLSGPVSPDIPPGLYAASLEVRWLRQISERIMLNSSVKPGWFSDFQTNNTQAIRAPAQSFVIYEWNPELDLIAGIVYLDRNDVNLLPAAGVIWKPNSGVRIEAVIPRPGAFFRYRRTPRFEDWFTIAGEFGGGQWAVERADGADDVLSSRDYRIVSGIERKNLVGGAGGIVEFGYVFGRKYEYYQSDTPDFEPGNTLLARVGLNY